MIAAMRTAGLSILLAAFCSPALAQLESGSMTIAVTRSIGFQPDQAVISTWVISGQDGSLEEIVGSVAAAGIAEADFSAVNVLDPPHGLLQWIFNLAVPIAQLQDKISSLRDLGLPYVLRGSQ